MEPTKISSSVQNIAPVNSATLRILIAESNQAHLNQLLATIDSIGKWTIYPCAEYTELIQTLSSGVVDLLILGNVDQGSCFEICRLCRKEWEHLPIILVSHDSTIPDFYRHWVSEKGFGDVVSSDPSNRDDLVRVVQNVTSVIRAQKQALTFAVPDLQETETHVALKLDGAMATTPRGTKLLSILLKNKVPVLKACGGQGRCATCHVFVEAGMECLTPPTEQELMTLSMMKIDQENARLACQCKVIDQGLSISMPKGKYLGSEAELESLVGKRAQQSLIHPLTGEVLVHEGKLILRTALEKMQAVNQEFEREMGVLLSRNGKKRN
ncbi:MAG: 2Fe-2S iron-sulfur cluster-binding protein [Pseudanabaenaceae cyanobacterium bins.68]|nr:2Fe-2S iron-sulfur cluster-binding protein [Pseudanabaenaceae cyanobacterium bins.68]